MAELLVVEDDTIIGQALQSGLRTAGHQVIWAHTGGHALHSASAATFDLILLDLGLPDVDGVDLCRQLRDQQPAAVLIILTARDAEMDIIVGLDAGADDYLTKPIRLAELLARIHAHLRRSNPLTDRQPVLTVGPLRVDTRSRRVHLVTAEIALRAKEFDLLARLAAEPGVAIGRETLINDVWDEHWFGPTKTLDVHIAALRRKLGPTAPAITTLRGHGYRLEHPTPRHKA